MAFQDKLKPISTTVPQAGGFQSKLKPVRTQNEFRFNVPETPMARENKIARYQQEAQQSQKEAEKANSFLGKLGNFTKAVGSTLASSEVGLGKSLAKIIGAGDTTLTDAQKQATDTQVNLLKTIREKEARGEDTTRLKQTYNTFINDPSHKKVAGLLKDQQTLPTTGEVVGQMGGTALDLLTAGTYGKAKTGAMSFGQLAPKASPFLQKTAVNKGIDKVIETGVATGLPELSSIAGQKASGLLTKKGLGNIGKGFGVGYASDVTQGLQGARGEENTGTGAFIPGIGTAIGVGLPVISEGTQSIKNQFTQAGREIRATGKRTDVLNTLERDNSKVRGAFENASRKGVDVKDALTKTNLLNGAVDSNGTISTKLALQNFDDEIAPFEGGVRKVIEEEGATISAKNLDDRLQVAIKNSKLEGGALTEVENRLQKEFGGLFRRADKGGNIPLTAVHDAKIFIASHQNYTDTGANAVNKEVARILKEVVEENTKTLDVDAYNKGLSKLYAVRDVLEALNGKKVEGGRLGKHFSTVVGGMVGSQFGPLTAIVGAETGRGLKGMQMSRAMGSDIAGGLQIPEEITGALAGKTTITPQQKVPVLDLSKKTPTGTLNLQSKSRGSLKTNQAPTKSITIRDIPDTIPPKATKSSKGLGTVLPKKKP